MHPEVWMIQDNKEYKPEKHNPSWHLGKKKIPTSSEILIGFNIHLCASFPKHRTILENWLLSHNSNCHNHINR